MHPIQRLALSILLASGAAWAQVPSQPAGTLQAGERHPQAGCLGAIRRELGGYAGAIDQGIKTGWLDPNQRPHFDRILSELTSLEASARVDKNLTADACKSIYKRVVAENAGIQATMRARPYRPEAITAPPAAPSK